MAKTKIPYPTLYHKRRIQISDYFVCEVCKVKWVTVTFLLYLWQKKLDQFRKNIVLIVGNLEGKELKI